MKRLAFGFFTAALCCFIVFHIVPVSRHDSSSGWHIWIELFEVLRSVKNLDVEDMIIISGFLTGSILILSCPLLVSVLNRSRLGWWIGMVSSGMVMLGLGGVILSPIMTNISNFFAILNPGLICLLAALGLNFVGFFFLRRNVPPCPVVDPS
jgi:hypothetical protein